MSNAINLSFAMFHKRILASIRANGNAAQ